MNVEEFRSTLPHKTRCDQCRKKIAKLDWHVGPFGSGEWMGLCLVRCPSCSRQMVAAAGTSNEAHHRAQMMRLELVLKVDGYDWSRPLL